MRISTIKGDAGYVGGIRGIVVILDGTEIKDCIMADDEIGECIVCSRDSSGNLQVVNGEIHRNTLRGKVEIIIPDNLAKYFQGKQ